MVCCGNRYCIYCYLSGVFCLCAGKFQKSEGAGCVLCVSVCVIGDWLCFCVIGLSALLGKTTIEDHNVYSKVGVHVCVFQRDVVCVCLAH